MKLFSYLVSPTLFLAHLLKRSKSGKARAILIKRLNWAYFLISIASAILIQVGDLRTKLNEYAVYFWICFVLSRCNEIFLAFLRDAYDKLGTDASNSDLTFRDRLSLSLRSYIELIFNFAIFYFWLPISFWKTKPPGNILESIYFSGVTIVTLGYGDITPSHWLPQLITIYEVFCGFVLIIVCFAIYVGKTQPHNIK